jgi:hypothetical protein
MRKPLPGHGNSFRRNANLRRLDGWGWTEAHASPADPPAHPVAPALSSQRVTASTEHRSVLQ